MKKADLLKALENLDDDAEIVVIHEDEQYDISKASPDWTSSSEDPPRKIPDNKRGIIFLYD